jgi:hypothetical protein
MQRIALRWPAYGYSSGVHAELLRPGWTVNHQRVSRVLREDNLLCVRRRKFLLGTTDSRHGLPIYPNVAADMVLTTSISSGCRYHLQHEEIPRSDVSPAKAGAGNSDCAPVLIGCNEFPIGYSLAGCPPAEPASASPTGDHAQH